MPNDHANVPDIPADNDAESVLKWAIDKFGGRVAIASSFGAEDVVLIDMAARIDPFVRVFTLDAGRLHQETYELMDVVRDRERPYRHGRI